MKIYIDASDTTTFGTCDVFMYIFATQCFCISIVSIFDAKNAQTCIIYAVILVLFTFVVNVTSYMLVSGKLEKIKKNNLFYFSLRFYSEFFSVAQGGGFITFLNQL